MTIVILVLMPMKRIQIIRKLTSICTIIAMLALLVTATMRPVAADDPSNLEITNLSGTSINLSYAQFLEMPKTVVNADLYCDGALLTHGNWSGTLLSYLLTQAQATPEVSSIQFAASDGYTVAIPIDLAMQPQLIVAYEKDDIPLVEGLRLIVPGANGAVWISKITKITMSTNGADYPPGVSAGGGTITDLMRTQNNTIRELPTPQQALQPQPANSENTSSIHVTSHSNDTDPYQPSTKPQSPTESISLQTELIISTAFASTILVAIALVAYGRKKKRSLDNSVSSATN